MQGCSLGLERLETETFKTVSRRFLERLGLVSVLKFERLGLVSVLRVQRLGLVSVLKVDRLDRSRDLTSCGVCCDLDQECTNVAHKGPSSSFLSHSMLNTKSEYI